MRACVLVVVAALALAGRAQAQEAKDSVLRRVTGALAPGAPIRVSTPLGRWAGRLRRVSDDTVFLGSMEHPAAARFSAIDTLWRRGNRERLASNVGMVTLGIVGAAAVTALSIGGAEGATYVDDVDGKQWGAFALGAVAGAAVGWFTGALVGKAIPRWVRLYPTSP